MKISRFIEKLGLAFLIAVPSIVMADLFEIPAEGVYYFFIFISTFMFIFSNLDE